MGLILILASCGGIGAAEPYVEGEVLVTFKPGVTEQSAAKSLKDRTLTVHRRFDGLSRMRGRETGLIRAHNWTTAALIESLRQDPEVETVEPNYLRHVFMAAPNDVRFGSLWGLNNTGQVVEGVAGTAGSDIRFLPAWALARADSSNPPVVAVIDTGMDYTHPDLTNNAWLNPGEIAGNNLDDDGNGYVDDWRGYDFASEYPDPFDMGYHGTHVAGTIAAGGNNGLGVIGVNYHARIMPLCASGDGETLPNSAVIEAIQYATMMKTRGVNIVAINASFGGSGSNSTERAAIVAAGNAGIVFCAAAGNETNNNDLVATYPASYGLTNMIVVAATDQTDALANFSNYGAHSVNLAAPGWNILSTFPVAAAGVLSSVKQGNTTYTAYTLEYSGYTTGFTGVVYACGLGNPADFPAAVSNNIALIQRGTLTFASKVANAMTAGARAVIIYNNLDADYSYFTLGSDTGDWIPAVAISIYSGQSIQTNVSAIVVNQPDASQMYEYLSGTSMAAPHVSGAVAFAAWNFPAETMAQRIQRILTNATVIPALSTKVASGRRLNLLRMVDSDANGLPDWWEQEYFQTSARPGPAADTDQDGLSNLGEWLAGTNPTNALSVLKLAVQPAGNNTQATLSWPSVTGKIYQIRRSTNLLSGFLLWQTNIPATAPLNTFTDTMTVPAGSRYYQIGVEE